MSDKPIIFNDAMVRAILDGRKTQTRRVMKPQLGNGWEFGTASAAGIQYGEITSSHPKKGRFGVFIRREVMKGSGKFEHDLIPCPYGRPGDLLWVREAWREYDNSTECGCLDHCCCPPTGTPIHRATGDDGESKWRPSIHMPRWASRITLEITRVRVERLQDISVEDARSEGCDVPDLPPEVHGVAGDFAADERTTFAILWNRINGAGAWNQNPWVWVIEFRVHHFNVDALIAEREAASDQVDKRAHRE